jgi:UDP-sulfoquinovose synthase
MKKTILILGANGYIGWALVQRMSLKYPNYTIVCVDNYSRDKIVELEMESYSATPIRRKAQRLEWVQSFCSNVC